MRLPAIIGHAAELCRIIRKSRQADDAVTSQYLRSKKYIGSRDRKAISAIVFSTLRFLGYCERITNSCVKAHSVPQEQYGRLLCLVAIAVSRELEEPVAQILGASFSDEAVFDAMGEDELAHVVRPVWTSAVESFSLEAGDILPSWLEEDVETSTGKKLTHLDRLAYAQSAPLCLRVNRPTTNTAEVQNYLQTHDIRYSVGQWSSECLVLPDRVNLRDSDLLRNGLVEVQDEASQLFGLALQPHSQMRVLDACAGAGGKSLHIADLMEYDGEILASDIDYRRLKRMIPRLRTVGARNVVLHRFDKHVLPIEQFNGTFDAVVIDAPCSGLGTIRRSPMIKWRSSEGLVGKFHRKQVELLHLYWELVAPGGYLLYATCSIHSRENSGVVDEFLQQIPHAETSAELYPEALRNSVQQTAFGNSVLQLYPHIYHTDGFFICKIRKNG